MKTRNIRQSVVLMGASPHDVYEALMDSSKHSQFTGGKADISREVGGKFSAFDGYCEGTNLRLVPDKEIVQTWRANDWTEGHYSRIRFSLKADEGNTRLTFTQTGVPDEQYDDIARGWREYYWAPMKKMLEGLCLKSHSEESFSRRTTKNPLSEGEDTDSSLSLH